MLLVCIKYSMYDLICDVISRSVWSCDVDKTNVGLYDKIMIENQKKRENIKIKRNFYINLHLIDGLGMEFTAC